MMQRKIHVSGTQLLLSLHRDNLAIAKALKEQNYIALHGATEIAWSGPDKSLAITDPPLYKALSYSITMFFMKGYAILSREKLTRLAHQEAHANDC